MIAVEPIEEMRSVLAPLAPAAEVLGGTAEELPLADRSVDAVTVGQAFHWFDPNAAIREIARVLRPDGAMALIWNIRELSDQLQWRLNELLRPHRGETPSEHERPWRESIAASPLFGACDERSFEWVQLHTADELVERIASVSFVAWLQEAVRDGLLARVREAVAGLPEPFPFRYRTDVHVYPRTPSA